MILFGAGIFLSTHIILIQCYYFLGIYKKYTDWVYTHFTICLIAHALFNNKLILNTLFTMSYANAHGLVGIHGFYIATGYKLLEEFALKISSRYKIKKQPLVVYIFLDGIIHVFPCIVIRQFDRRRIITGYPGVFLLSISWLCNISYVPTLQNGSFNPCYLYKVKQRKAWQIYLALTIVSSIYFFTGYHIFYLH